MSPRKGGKNRGLRSNFFSLLNPYLTSKKNSMSLENSAIFNLFTHFIQLNVQHNTCRRDWIKADNICNKAIQAKIQHVKLYIFIVSSGEKFKLERFVSFFDVLRRFRDSQVGNQLSGCRLFSRYNCTYMYQTDLPKVHQYVNKIDSHLVKVAAKNIKCGCENKVALRPDRRKRPKH